MPPELRICACGCNTPFTTTHPRYRHAPGHKPKKGQHYAAGERRQRTALFATWPDDTPCPWCNRPMTNQQRATGQLISGHVIDKARGGAHMGLRYEHASCGKRAGAILGLQLRQQQKRTPAW